MTTTVVLQPGGVSLVLVEQHNVSTFHAGWRRDGLKDELDHGMRTVKHILWKIQQHFIRPGGFAICKMFDTS